MAVCNPTVYGSYTRQMTTGKNWRFKHIARGTSYLDDYIETTGGTQRSEFEYDSLDRLVSAQASGAGSGLYSRTYAYDAIGNLTNKSDLGTYDYDDSMSVSACTSGTPTVKPHAVDDITNGWWFDYDCNGNMITRVNDDGTHTLTYNAENKMATATIGNTIITYTYDGNGDLVKKVTTTGSTSTTDLYIGDHFAKMNGVYRKTYLFGAQRVAVRNGGTLTYLHSDHLGSASTATTTGQAIHSEQRYYPYGEERWSSGTLPTDYEYTSQRHEDALNLYDYRARYYDPQLGRFVQPDTIVPNLADSQAYNRYMYVNGNPVKYIDPNGHFGVITILGLTVVLGLVLTIPSSTTDLTPTPYDVSLSQTSGARIVNGEGNPCTTLPGCFSQSGVTSPNMAYVSNFSQEEFYALADEVAADLYSHNVKSPGLLTGRDRYDTPFYDGGGRQGVLSGHYVESEYAGQSVCIDGLACSDRSAVNYFAQGMWGARSGEYLSFTSFVTSAWKKIGYGEEPSADVLYWLEFGYYYYLDWLLENYGDDPEVVRYVDKMRGEAD